MESPVTPLADSFIRSSRSRVRSISSRTGLQLPLALAFREEEDAALGLVEDGVQFARVLAGQLLDLPACLGQPATHRLVLDDVGVRDGAGGHRHHLVQGHEVGRTADGLQLAPPLQLLAEGEVVHWTLGGVEPQHGGENMDVARAGEVVRVRPLPPPPPPPCCR